MNPADSELAGTLCFYFHTGVNHEPFCAEHVTGALKDIQNVLMSWRNLKSLRGELTDVRECTDIQNGGGGKIRICISCKV